MNATIRFDITPETTHAQIQDFLKHHFEAEANGMVLHDWVFNDQYFVVSYHKDAEIIPSNGNKPSLIMEWVHKTPNPPRKGPTLACINAHLPKGRPYTLDDLSRAIAECNAR